MTYIDCYLVPVPLANKAAYERLAAFSAQVLREYGVLRTMDCWLDEAGPEAASYHGELARAGGDGGEPVQYGSFRAAAGAREGETVVVSWAEWADKAARDTGMARFTADPRMQFEGQEPVFDGARAVAAGFIPMPG